MAAPNSISVPKLLRKIGLPDAPTIIDICLDDDFNDDPHLIPGSLRHNVKDIDGIVRKVANRSCVIVCQKGLKLSQGAVAMLRNRDVNAEYLEGGMFAWRAHSDTMRIPAKNIPAPQNGATLWVTRHRPKIDRIACPWLIRRFVDPSAEFLFVSPSEVASVADKFEATPFDVEGVFWSHRGEQCTFDTMVQEFCLQSPSLDRLATVIRAADTNRHDLSPQAAGLLALSVGLSRQFKNDVEQLKAGLPIYDALYRWARDGIGETHDWPTGHSA